MQRIVNRLQLDMPKRGLGTWPMVGPHTPQPLVGHTAVCNLCANR
jgi:hypothetical protein